MISLLQLAKNNKFFSAKVTKASILIAMLSCTLANAQTAGYNNAYQQYYQQQSGYYQYNNDAKQNPNYTTPYQYNSSNNPEAPNASFDRKNIRTSYGKALGLRNKDSLALKSSVALVIDQDNNRVLYEKNTHAVLPIASITKVMTSLVVMDAKLPLDEILTVTEEDVDYQKNTSSRLKVGQRLTRQEMLLLALMSSENRAASALGRYYPGGKPSFIAAMNRKAKSLGMNDTRYVDSSGLSSQNVSSAYDLGRVVYAASQYPLIKSFSTNISYNILGINSQPLIFKNTNRLVRAGNWEIGMQKTGYISEAGKCLVMQAKVLGHSIIMVFLDSSGSADRFNDALRIKAWLESGFNTQNANNKNSKTSS